MAVDDAVVLKPGKDGKVAVLDNDGSDRSTLDQDTLSITASPALAEELRVHGDHLHYKARDDASGTDRLRYRVCDEAGGCAEAAVLITFE